MPPKTTTTKPLTLSEAVAAVYEALGESTETVRTLQVRASGSILYTTTANITRSVRFEID